MLTDAGIAGMGFYFPKKVVDTREEALKVSLPERVYQNIGIKQIYKPSEEDHPSKMSIESARKAIQDANISASDIDLIIVTGFMRDYLSWQMGGLIKEEIGAKNAFTVEVIGGCAAYFQAVEVAVDQIRGSSDIHNVLITCGERLFGYGWPTFLSSGGQSVIIQRNCKQFNFLGFSTSNLIKYHQMGFIPDGGTYRPFTEKTDWKDDLIENFEIDKDIYKEHVKPIVFEKFIEVAEDLFNRTGFQKQDLDYMVTIVQQYTFGDKILEALKIPNLPNAKKYSPYLGHFNGADTFILLDKAKKKGDIKKGDIILNLGLGGVAWFASLIRF